MFIVAIVLLVLGGIARLVAVGVLPASRSAVKWTARGLVAFGVLFLFFSSFTIVSTKNVGVKTSFGAPAGEIGDGLHVKWPWQKVTEMDAAIQTDSHTAGGCINVRIANQQTACVPISIRWRIVQGKADELFKDYRTFEHVRDSLVTRYLTASVNNQLRGYNPLNSIGLSPAQGGNGNPSLSEIAGRITVQMRKEVGGQIDVLNTLIPIIHFDDATQKRINQLQQQIALTRIAEQEIKTNDARSRANNALAKSVATTPNVLVSTCLDILSTMVKQGQSVPPGFSCWPGSGLSGIIAGGK